MDKKEFIKNLIPVLAEAVTGLVVGSEVNKYISTKMSICTDPGLGGKIKRAIVIGGLAGAISVAVGKYYREGVETIFNLKDLIRSMTNKEKADDPEEKDENVAEEKNETVDKSETSFA